MSGPSGHGCRCSYKRLNHCPGPLPSDKQNGIIDTGQTGLHWQEFQRHPGRSAVRGWRLHPRCAGCQFHKRRHRHRRRDWNVQWWQAHGGSADASVKTPAGLWKIDPDGPRRGRSDDAGWKGRHSPDSLPGTGSPIDVPDKFGTVYRSSRTGPLPAAICSRTNAAICASARLVSGRNGIN